MINSTNDIMELHLSHGEIEEAYIKVHLDNKVMMLNRFTMRMRRGNCPKEEIREWNRDIDRHLKQNRNLTKEVKEFVSLFSFFEKAKIKSGYIEKSETPDFILTRNGKKTGIEITKIYIGNDWVADKLSEEVRQYRMRNHEIEDYLAYQKYKERVVTYKVRGGLAIMPNTEHIDVEEYITELKNKIFTKVRKLSDDYQKFDENIIFVEVVSSDFLRKKFDVAKMSAELQYYTNYIESDFHGIGAKMVMKMGKDFIEYDLVEHTYQIL